VGPNFPHPNATIEVPKEKLTTGSTFAGRYQIIEELGKGGMGKVYKVHDTKIKEKIALKLIKPEIAKDKKTIERFNNELRLARKIRHKNICQMFDLGEEKGTHFITMEFVPGQDLKGLIRQTGQLAVGTTINITKQICDGLTEAHKSGVIHRDLKPSNIMIDKEGDVRIMDFGIARSLEAKGITGAGVMIGTPEYMSPEQVEGKEVDQRSDIYSLGIILYEMATGQVPFEGDTPFTIGMKHKGEMPQNPKELNTQISDDLNNVILRCLEKDKENRFQSTGEVHAELENIGKGIPTTEKVIPKKKPLTSKEITVSFSLKKLFIPIITLIAVVIIAIILWQVLPSKKAPSLAPSGKPYLAVMYFQNNTGDKNLDIWRDGLSRLLIADLSQSKYIRVVPDDQLYSLLNQLNLLEANNYSTEDLREVASQSRATHILKGILTKSGDSFRINTTLQEAISMEIIDSKVVDGKGEGSLHTMVDDLTKRIKESFKLTEQEIASDIDIEVVKITTSSPEAYKYYVEGIRIRRTGNFYKSIELMEKAISIDPEFAMAHKFMSICYLSLNDTVKSNKYIKKAFELADRLPERELYFIQGSFYARSEKTYDKAFNAYNKLLKLYPEDWMGMINLGILYNDLEDYDKAIEYHEKCIQLKVEALALYANLPSEYLRKGLYEKSKKILDYYIKNINDNAIIRWYLATTYFHQGEFNLALVEVERSLSLNPTLFRNFWLKGDIYLNQGNLFRAEEEYQKLLEQEEEPAQFVGMGRLAELSLLQGRIEEAKDLYKTQIELAKKMGDKSRIRMGHLALSYLYRKSGSYEKALKECEKVWIGAVEEDSVDHQRRALYEKGLAYLGMKSIDKAQQTAKKLKEMIDRGIIRNLIRIYYHIEGKIEIEREEYSHAIDSFKKALPLISAISDWHIILADSLGTAYFRVGNLEKAQEEYEKIISPIPGRIFYGDIYAKAFYNLGKIHEQQGDIAKAIKNYQKFLDLWKDADPGIAEVDDARKRLTGLKSQ
jgi:serine/threonine protein kinase/predicted Zn-dependent protease